MFTVFFLVVFALSFVGVVGWQNREDFVGGDPNKHLALGIFAAVFFLFLIIAMPHS